MKRSNLFSVIAILSFAILSGTSCQDEEVKVSNENFTKGNVSEIFDNDSVLTIDGKRMEWKISEPTNKTKLSKGFRMNLSNPNLAFELTFGTATYTKDSSKKYKTMKVYRRNDPGKYFYVMVENLDVKLDTACWAYDRDESNVEQHGRLYTWNAANTVAQQLTMELPVYNPKGKQIGTMDRPGRLLSLEDVLDIFAMDSIGHLPEYGYDVDQCVDDWCFYYDAFIFGVENAHSDVSKGYSVLGGIKVGNSINNQYYGAFTGLNNYGSFWMGHGESWIKGAHYDFQIKKQYDGFDRRLNYVAFINSMIDNRHGLSVRCVFEPKYPKKK